MDAAPEAATRMLAYAQGLAAKQRELLASVDGGGAGGWAGGGGGSGALEYEEFVLVAEAVGGGR